MEIASYCDFVARSLGVATRGPGFSHLVLPNELRISDEEIQHMLTIHERTVGTIAKAQSTDDKWS